MENISMRTCTLATLLTATVWALPASAQTDADALWTAFEEADVAFQDAQAACEEADPATTGGDRTCRDAIEAGLTLADAVEAVLDGVPDVDAETREAAIDLLLTTQQIVGTYMVDVGDCEDAVEVLDAVLESPLLGNRRSLENAASRWRGEAEACRGGHAEPEPIAETPDPEMTAETPIERSGRSPAGYVLVGLGAAAVGGAAIWELALNGDRQDFVDARNSCEGGGPCDPVETQRLADRIDGAKIPTAVLYGVGGASLVTGIIVLATGGGGGEDTLSLSPTVAPDYAGVRFGARF